MLFFLLHQSYFNIQKLRHGGYQKKTKIIVLIPIYLIFILMIVYSIYGIKTTTDLFSGQFYEGMSGMISYFVALFSAIPLYFIYFVHSLPEKKKKSHKPHPF